MDNQLNRSIPSSMGELQQLKVLWLDSNQLTGPIPNSLSGCQNLLMLSLTDNCINETIPPSLGELHQLQALYLTNNSLTGEKPQSVEYIWLPPARTESICAVLDVSYYPLFPSSKDLLAL